MKQGFVFPGQGSQSIGMGREFYDTFPTAKEVFAEVDDSLKQNLSNLIFTGDQDDLTLTENAQPALMAVSIAIVRTLVKESGRDLQKFAEYFAGHSLGEYTALCAAGAISLSDTAKLLKIRGQAMQNAVPVGKGAMAAIIGLSFDQCEDVVKKAAKPNEFCVIANDNCPGQIVLSGHIAAIKRAINIAPEHGARRAIKLAVSAPFHCLLMEPAAKAMQLALNNVQVVIPTIPVIANVSVDIAQTPEKIRENLVSQVTGKVRWRETGEKFGKLGLEQITEIGAGKVLTGMMKRINDAIKASAINTPKDMEVFLKDNS